MKNSLQLQLNLKIKCANILLKARKFQQAVQGYSKCLELFEDNRKFNDSISGDLRVVILSLRGVANGYCLKFDEAQQDLDKSYLLSPYNTSTLNRRARFYFNRKRYAQAIQDIGKAMIYEPENIKHEVLISQIKEAVEKISEEKEKARLKKLIEGINKVDQDEIQDEEQFINFSNLKKIDRVSIKPQKRRTILDFKEDYVFEYQNEQNSEAKKQNQDKRDIQTILRQQDEQLNNIVTNQIQEKIDAYNVAKIINKNKGKSRKSVLRASFASSSDHGSRNSIPQNQSRGSISAISVKNIDGKVIKHDKKEQKIRFISMFSSSSNQCNEQKLDSKLDSSCIIDADQGPTINSKILQTKTHTLNVMKQTDTQKHKQKQNKGARKSCLRSSNLSKNSEMSKQNENSFQQCSTKKESNFAISSNNNTTRSSFFRLKNIDRPIDKKSQSERKNEGITENNQQNLSQSDDSNEHNVFEEHNQDQIMKALENMNNISGGSLKGVGKKSILKRSTNDPITSKTSVVSKPNLSSWGKQSAKKSVCFRTN